MADERIEDISNSPITAIAAGDLFVGLDVSDATDDASGTAKNITAATMGLTEIATASPTTADVTGVVGTLHCLNISGLTADRRFNLPTTAKVGERVGVFITTGDDTYELDLHTTSASSDTINGVDAGTNSWSRLFITGECVVFRCITADSAWIVEYDGRIPCEMEAVMTTTNSTAIPHSSWITWNTLLTTYSQTQTEVKDNSSSFASGVYTVRRAATYGVLFKAVYNSLTASTVGFVAMYQSTNQVAFQSFARAVTGSVVVPMNTMYAASVGDTLTFQTLHTDAAGSPTIGGATLPSRWTSMYLLEQLK